MVKRNFTVVVYNLNSYSNNIMIFMKTVEFRSSNPRVFTIYKKTVREKQSSVTYQQAKAFKSKNLFILTFLQPSYVSTPFNMVRYKLYYLCTSQCSYSSFYNLLYYIKINLLTHLLW